MTIEVSLRCLLENPWCNLGNDIKALGEELETIGTIGSLTNVFSNLASIQLKAIRHEVLNAKLFFNDLWNLYSQLRVVGKSRHQQGSDGSRLSIVITSPAGLGGGADQQIIRLLVEDLESQPSDICVIGSNGVSLLKAKEIEITTSFEVPDVTKEFSVDPLLDLVQDYDTTVVYYQNYVSLGTQEVTKLELLSSAQALTDEEKVSIASGESSLISPKNFIFEPSIDEVLRLLEESMVSTALTQLLMESRLSQLARRFTSMTLAHQRALEMKQKLEITYNAAKRSRRDEMTRQTTIAMRSK